MTNVVSDQLQNVTVDNTADLQRLKRGIEIRRPKKKRNLQNDTRIKACTARYDAGAYSKLQFVRAISPRLGIHSDGFLAEEISDDDENDCVNVDEQQQQHSVPATSNTAAAGAGSAKCDVCLLDPRERVVLVPCGHSISVLSVLTLWPLCRTDVRCSVVHLLTWLIGYVCVLSLANLNV